MNQLFIVSTRLPTLQLQAPPELNLRIETLSDGAQLQLRLAEVQPALILVDIDFVNATPNFWAHKIDRAPDTAVILLVPTEKRSSAIKMLSEGAYDYLLFPIEFEELWHKTRQIIEHRHLKQNGPAPLSNVSPEIELMLDELLQEMMRTLQLDEAISIIFEKSQLIWGAKEVAIWLADANEELSPEPTAVLGNAQNHLSTIALQATAARKIFREVDGTAIGIPLISGEKMVGVLTLGFSPLTPFNPAQIQALAIFGNQVTIALENARLFHQLASAYIDLAQNRETLQRQRHTLGVLFDSITDGLYLLDQQLNIVAINQVETDQLGRQADELIGQNLIDLPGTSPEFIRQVNDTVKDGQKRVWSAQDSELTPFLENREFRIYPVCNRLAQTEQVIIFAQNVADRHRWQASVFRSANLAAVGQLAGSVAHQINNPLTVTMTNSQLLMLEFPPTSDIYQLAQGIFKAGQRIQHSVANLQDISTQEQHNFTETNLTDTLEDALALVSHSLRKAKVRVTKNYRVQPTLKASIGQLKLVWINLLLNALDAVANVTDVPQIFVSTEESANNEVAVCIADNGQGFSAQQQERLFQPFFSTKPTGHSIGLGLYAAQAIIEQHHGRISVNSRAGEGAAFTVTLPLNRKPE